ncbi:MAG: hypothetical protein Q8O09_05540 [Bacillota bacterium]|nr:hypothetical protein [Bacillota bacterium]
MENKPEGKNIRRWRIALLVVGALMTAIAVLAMAMYGTARAPKPGAEKWTPSPMPSVVGVENVENKAVVISADCVETVEYRYLLCGHTKYVKQKAGSEIAGLTEEEFRLRYPGFQMLQFSPTAIQGTVIINAYCPDHYILKAIDGMVDIYRIKPGTGEFALYKRLGMHIEEFKESCKQGVARGMAFDSIEDLEGFLEDQES